METLKVFLVDGGWVWTDWDPGEVVWNEDSAFPTLAELDGVICSSDEGWADCGLTEEMFFSKLEVAPKVAEGWGSDVDVDAGPFSDSEGTESSSAKLSSSIFKSSEYSSSWKDETGDNN